MDHTLLIPVIPERHDEMCRTVEAICRNYPGKYWRNLEDAAPAARYPESFLAELEQAGFLAAGVPEQHGGIGLSIDAWARIIETIHAAGCNADAVAEQMTLTEILTRYGQADTKTEILPRLADGAARLQSIAIWERGSGLDTARIQMKADSAADGFELSGSKRWVRFADRSDLMLVVARTGGCSGNLSLFLVDARTNGSRITIQPTAAMNNYGGCEVTFDRVVVPANRVIGDVGKGGDYLTHMETVSGILAAAAAAGCARFFSRKGVDYANDRVVFGNPIGKYQGIQFPLAQAYMESQGAGLLLQLAIALYEGGRSCRAEAMMAQHVAVQAAWESAEAAFTTHGGFAFAREYDIERKWREVRFMRSEAATSLTNVAVDALNLPALG